MQKRRQCSGLTEREKASLWANISIVFFAISVALLFNQFVPKELDEFISSIAPLWVLALFIGLTIVTGLNSWRHGRPQRPQDVIEKQTRRIFRY